MMGIKCGCVFLELAEQSKTGNTYNWKDKISTPLSLNDLSQLSYIFESDLKSDLIINDVLFTVSDSSLSMYNFTTKSSLLLILTPSLKNDLANSLKQAKFIIHGWV